MKPLKVLLISHTCQARLEGQPKAQFIGATPNLELRVLVPDRWYRYGAWRAAQKPSNPSYEYQIERVAWPWTGPGQTYGHWYPALPRLLKQFRPDIIDIWEEPWSLLAAQTCFWRDKWLPNTKIVAETEQNLDKKLPPPFEPFRSYVFRRANYVVGRSSAALEIAARKGFAGPSRVVPNAVDVALFTSDGPKIDYFEAHSYVVGYAGRLVASKGIEDLLRAVALCAPDVKLLLIGSGPDEAQFRNLSLELGLEKRVHFAGMQPADALPPLLRSMRVLVLPSRTTARWQEQFGRVLIEAGACGVPVIGSSSGAIPEVIGSGEDAMGLVFPEGNIWALAEAIETLRGDAKLARHCGENGVRRARDEFSWQRVASQMVEIYRELGSSKK